MKRLACQYAIIRFLPYAETGEFANVGVLLACPATGFFSARLMPTKHTRRITAFFDRLDKRVYRDSLNYFREELERVRELVRGRFVRGGEAEVQRAFMGLATPRETLLRFGDVRALLAEDPEAALDQLYGRFVERDFADRSYHDRLVERTVREALTRAELRQHFVENELGDEYVHVRVPFVHLRDGRPVAAIKPLDLAKSEPNQVFEVGGHWLERVRWFKRHNLLPDMLIVIREPDISAPEARHVADELRTELRDQGVGTTLAQDSDSIVRFAKSVLH